MQAVQSKENDPHHLTIRDIKTAVHGESSVDCDSLTVGIMPGCCLPCPQTPRESVPLDRGGVWEAPQGSAGCVVCIMRTNSPKRHLPQQPFFNMGSHPHPG